MKKFFAFLKGLFKGLLDIFIIAIELLFCAGVVYFLVNRPITSPIEKKIVKVDRGDPNSGRGIEEKKKPVVPETPTYAPLFPPALEWKPATVVWEWDYARGVTKARWVPGYWKIADGPPAFSMNWGMSPPPYYGVWNIPTLIVETF